MKHSYEGIGAWSATFTTADAKEGQVVKLSGSGAVAACSAGDAFCGVAEAVRGIYCGVQMGGLARVGYTGTAPTVGLNKLTADGEGGVCTADGGKEYLVVAVNSADSTCTIKL